MDTRTIYTIDARDNIRLETMKEFFSLDENHIYLDINAAFDSCVAILKDKNIDYKNLKSALVPTINRKEIAFVFDSLQIDDCWYAQPIMSALIPLLDKKSSHSVLIGDYIGSNDKAILLRDTFFKYIKSIKSSIFRYQHHSQYFIVYINNLSETMVDTINKKLNSFAPYVGYFDLTYSSFIKTYLSTILMRAFLKYKNIILQPHEDDRNNNEDINTFGYSFEDFGYICRSIQSMYYDLFLSYKIERPIFTGFECDTTFSINAMTSKVFNISDFSLIIEDKKLQYLLENKTDNMKLSGMAYLSIEQIQNMIKEKINSNYMYNLTYVKEHNVLKFNIIIETTRIDNYQPFKLLLALEYNPIRTELRLITMF